MYKYPKRKDKIVIDAIKLMDDRGLHGLTIGELAKREGITEPAIYRQYKNKNDIIRIILEDFAKYDKSISLTVLRSEDEPLDMLIKFGKLYTDYYENYPEITSVLFSIEYLKTDQELYDIFRKIMNDRKETIIEILKKMNINSSVLRNELAELINGILLSQTMFWKMDGCKYSLSERVRNNLRFLMKSGGEIDEKSVNRR